MVLFLSLIFLVPILTHAALMDREEVFDFTVNPAVARQPDGTYRISFTSAGNCDVTVSISNSKGKILRHLASGVLGANAPEPFQQNSLSQSIVWDGKDDRGNMISDSCVVKVALGLNASYDIDFSDFSTFTTTAGIGLCVDKEGNLYTAQNGTVRRFSRKGVYDRTLLPPQSSVNSTTFAARPWVETKWGDFALRAADWYVAFPNFTSTNLNYGSPVVGPDGRLAVMFQGQNSILHLFGPDGSLTATSSVMFGGRNTDGYHGNITYKMNAELGGGIHHLALSPKGGWLYLSGAANALLRYRWIDLKGPTTPVANQLPIQIFVGDTTKDSTGSGARNDRFNILAGVACDSVGNVYVADNGNNRIQVYDSNAVFVKTIPFVAPYQIAIHPNSGNIYVLSFRSGDLPPAKKLLNPKLVKLSPSGTQICTLAVAANWNYWHYPYTAMAPDFTSDTTFIWLFDKKGVYKIRDNGNSFTETMRLGAERDTTFYVGTPPADGRMRSVADRANEEVYLLSGTWAKPSVRINGRTGKIDKSWSDKTYKNPITEVAVGPDGLIYAREGGFGAFITRYAHDGTPAPFSYGVPFPASRGAGTYVGKTAIYTGHWGWSNVWQAGFDVSPSGVIGAGVFEFSKDWLNAVFPAGGPQVPVSSLDQVKLSTQQTDTVLNSSFINSGYTIGNSELVELWNSDGSEKCLNAFIAPARGSGLFFGKEGSLYLTDNFTVPGQTNLISTPKSSAFRAGSLFKLGEKNNECPQAMAFKTTPASGQLKYDTWAINDVSWAIQDASATFPASVCGCGHERFDLDDFDRSWLPANHINSILVYDANGNKIIRIGRYGNSDSRGPGSLVPEPDIGLCQVNTVAASDEALYIVDPGNKRTLRAKLGYEKEVALNLDGTLNTAVDKIHSPKRFALHQNVPNPFNPVTKINYDLAEKSQVVLTLFDVRGQLVKKVVMASQDPGAHSFILDCGRYPSGLYVYELKAGAFIARKAMMLTR